MRIPTVSILATLFVLGIGLPLHQAVGAGGTDGDCIASCNDDCNLLIPLAGSRKECKTRCFAGRCAHPGALQLAANSDEAGIDCSADGACNEFCADGPVPDPDCVTPVACPCDIELVPMTSDEWALPTPSLFTCNVAGTNLLSNRLAHYGAYTSDATCSGDPRCYFIGTSGTSSQCIDIEQAQACAEAIGAYALALANVLGDYTVLFDTDPASCPPLALP